MPFPREELVDRARAAQRDDRLSTGALYGQLADRIEELENMRCQCEACKTVQHASYCAVHNAPALPIGKCSCGAEQR